MYRTILSIDNDRRFREARVSLNVRSFEMLYKINLRVPLKVNILGYKFYVAVVDSLIAIYLSYLDIRQLFLHLFDFFVLSNLLFLITSSHCFLLKSLLLKTKILRFNCDYWLLDLNLNSTYRVSRIPKLHI